MKIVDPTVTVCGASRNFVTLKLATEGGMSDLGDATPNRGKIAAASRLKDQRVDRRHERWSKRKPGTMAMPCRSVPPRGLGPMDKRLCFVRSGAAPPAWVGSCASPGSRTCVPRRRAHDGNGRQFLAVRHPLHRRTPDATGKARQAHELEAV